MNILLQIIILISTFLSIYLLKIINENFLKNIILIYSMLAIGHIFDFGRYDLFFFKKISKNNFFITYFLNFILISPIYIIAFIYLKISLIYYPIIIVGYIFILLNGFTRRVINNGLIMLYDSYQFLILLPISIIFYLLEINSEEYLLLLFILESLILIIFIYLKIVYRRNFTVDQDLLKISSHFYLFINKALLTTQVSGIKILIEIFLGADKLISYHVITSIIGKVQSISSAYYLNLVYSSGDCHKLIKYYKESISFIIIMNSSIILFLPYFLIKFIELFGLTGEFSIPFIYLITIATLLNCLSVIHYHFFSSTLLLVKYNMYNSAITLILTVLALYITKTYESSLVYIILIGSLINFGYGFIKLFFIINNNINIIRINK
jgi:hypothetical protein